MGFIIFNESKAEVRRKVFNDFLAFLAHVFQTSNYNDSLPWLQVVLIEGSSCKNVVDGGTFFPLLESVMYAFPLYVQSAYLSLSAYSFNIRINVFTNPQPHVYSRLMHSLRGFIQVFGLYRHALEWNATTIETIFLLPSFEYNFRHKEDVNRII